VKRSYPLPLAQNTYHNHQINSKCFSDETIEELFEVLLLCNNILLYLTSLITSNQKLPQNPRKMMTRIALLVGILAAVANGASNEALTLREKIVQALETDSLIQSQSRGIENCENKCEKAFNRMAYYISTLPQQRTFEFTACIEGCNQCAADLVNNAPKDNCFKMCKNRDWKSEGIIKGVIEPDKACIGGCIINTCQVVCSGGTTDRKYILYIISPTQQKATRTINETDNRKKKQLHKPLLTSNSSGHKVAV
jgi:hypothetical protein